MRQRIGYVFGGDRGLYKAALALDNLRYFAGALQRGPEGARRSTSCSTRGAQTGAKGVEGTHAGCGRGSIARGISDPPVVFLDDRRSASTVGARRLRS